MKPSPTPPNPPRPARLHAARLAGTLLAVATLALALALATGAAGDASHAGWPKINGKLIINKENLNETMRGDRDLHNELLGGNGDDTIYGGQVGDVIWGDYKPSGQPATQVDHIYAGNGPNFIYTSHGTNYVYTGTGHTKVYAHFGHGVVHCQSSRVIVYTTHRGGYRLVGCAHVFR
jgi:Ca2+-binding RTX toxin-like protein